MNAVSKLVRKVAEDAGSRVSTEKRAQLGAASLVVVGAVVFPLLFVIALLAGKSVPGSLLLAVILAGPVSVLVIAIAWWIRR